MAAGEPLRRSWYGCPIRVVVVFPLLGQLRDHWRGQILRVTQALAQRRDALETQAKLGTITSDSSRSIMSLVLIFVGRQVADNPRHCSVRGSFRLSGELCFESSPLGDE
jgi:hypothetical protein